MQLFLQPKKLVKKQSIPMPNKVKFCIEANLQKELDDVQCDISFIHVAFEHGIKDASLLVSNIKDETLQNEEFVLSIEEEKAQIRHKSAAGFYYALQTLQQLALNSQWCAMEIQDTPSVALRGALLDIGRDKIPSMKTLFEYIDFFAKLRYNHLELYMEGFSFDYPKYRYLFAQADPITEQEFVLLSAYAKAHFITLTPNQNCLGHMDQWLAKPVLKDLAESPQGFLHQNLYMRPPMTIDANDEQALELVNYFFSKILPLSDSEYVNVNLDEPFELGIFKNKEFCDKEGVAQLYLSYIKKIHSLCAMYGKKLMIWGDVIFNHPEIMSELPTDVMLLDWIYEGDASFKSHCELLQKASRDFCLCPGTSSWASIAGRSDNMVKNINDAVCNAQQYGAKGVMITDWGDLGHWQYFIVSQIPFVCCGQAMWSGQPVNLETVKNYCNKQVFLDENNVMFDLLFNLGNYYQLEHAPLYNTTLCFSVQSSKYVFRSKQEFSQAMERLLKLCANIAHENNITPTCAGINVDSKAIKTLLDNTLQQLQATNIKREDALVVKQEVENTIRFIRHGLQLYLMLIDDSEMCEQQKIVSQFTALDEIMQNHYILWKARNRISGYDRSTEHMNHLMQFYRQEMERVCNN